MPLPLRRVLVVGPSMAPTLRHGDVVLARLGGRGTPAPGAVVVVEMPDRPLSVKRVVRILPAGVWVEGDNPFGSTDSRELGPMPVSAVRGRVLARLWPRPGYIRRSRD